MFLLLLALTSAPALAADPAPETREEHLRAEFEKRLLEREAEILAAIETSDPELAAELRALREGAENDPMVRHRYRERLRRSYREVERMQADPDLVGRRQAMLQLRASLYDLSKKYATQSGDARAATRAEMEEVASELFELRQTSRRLRLEQLQARLIELKGEIEERDQNKADIIDRYIDGMLFDEEEL